MKTTLYISLISFIVYFIYMLYLSWELSIVVIISSAVSFFIPKIVGNKMSDKRKIESDQRAVLVETIENLIDGKELYHAESNLFFRKRFAEENQKYEEATYNLGKYVAFTNIFFVFYQYPDFYFWFVID